VTQGHTPRCPIASAFRGIPRSPSPDPIYDANGRKVNSRENRIRKVVMEKRERLLDSMIAAYPEIVQITGMCVLRLPPLFPRRAACCFPAALRVYVVVVVVVAVRVCVRWESGLPGSVAPRGLAGRARSARAPPPSAGLSLLPFVWVPSLFIALCACVFV
jgi:hypothetical protein